jgi:acylphosphatase
MSPSPLTAKRVFYTGRVQGVGFRYTAHRIAQGYSVTGYVKNLRDGRVELLAEGPTTEIQNLLQEIADAMSGNIENTDTLSEPSTGKYQSFTIAH